MARKQIVQKMKPILVRRRDLLRSSLNGELAHFNTSDEKTVGDEADSALDSDYGFINSQLAETESRELERIEHALQQMREGQYGVCELCGKNIPLARLQALPYATNCIGCQRAIERDETSRQLQTDWSRVTDNEDESRFSTLDMTSLVL